MSNEQKRGLSTDCVHAGEQPIPSAVDPSVRPIYQTAVYDFPDLHTVDAVYDSVTPGYIYARFGLPNHTALEEVASKLEAAEGAVACSSGMAAIAVTAWTLLKKGDEILVTEDCYGGSYSLMAGEFSKLGIASRFISTVDAASVGAAFSERTRAVLVETLSNPLWKVVDVPALAEVCRNRGVVLVVDNTVATPFLIRPLDHGADVVIHSATKFLGGHHDVTAGLIAGSRDFVKSAREVAARIGTMLSPFDAWLTVRGIKTFAVRMERICANALAVAGVLKRNARVERVFYPGLREHPQHAVVERTMRGIGGGMVSFEIKGGLPAAEKFIQRLQMIRLAPSLGGVSTTISHPAKTSQRSLTSDQREAIGIRDNLLRLSIGIENTEDIVRDLEQALGGL